MSETVATPPEGSVVHIQERRQSPLIYRRFAYRPLEASAFTRVLNLLPAFDPNANLECQLETIGRDDFDYEPVSYTWGRAEGGGVLYHDKREKIGITRTLDSMLRQLRRVDQPRRLWVDAICINQNDTHEKAQQVERMSKIYKDRHVLVWLGDDFWYGEDVLRFLGTLKDNFKFEVTTQDFNEPFDIDGKFSNLFSNNGSWLEWHMKIANIGGQDLQGSDSTLQLKLAVAAFYERPWFYRRWILQEMAFAATGTIYCGSTRLPLDEFVLVSYILMYQYSSFLGIQTYTSETIRSMFFLRSTYQFQRPARLGTLDRSNAKRPMRFRQHSNDDESYRDILWLLNSFWTSDCKDPRDRIYALLGLSRDAKRKFRSAGPDRRDLVEIPISYDVDCDAVYRRFAQSYLACFGKHASVFMLLQSAAAFCGRSQIRSSDWPSWIPDWSNVRKYTPFSVMQPDIGAYVSPSRHTGPAHMSLADSDGTKIRISGTTVDTVKAVLPFNWRPDQVDPAQRFAVKCVELAIIKSGKTTKETTQSRNTIIENVTRLLTGEGLDVECDHCQSQPWLTEDSMEQRRFDKRELSQALLALLSEEFELRAGHRPGHLHYGVEQGHHAQALRRALEVCKGRAFVILASGAFALCPDTVYEDDVIVAARGAAVPFAIRQHRHGGHTNEDSDKETRCFRLVGDCWIVGYTESSMCGPEDKDIVLV